MRLVSVLKAERVVLVPAITGMAGVVVLISPFRVRAFTVSYGAQ